MQDHNFEFGAESPQIAPARNPLSQDTAEVRGDAMKTLLVDGLDYDSRATFGKPIFSVAIFLVVLSSMVGISNCFVISADTPLSHLFGGLVGSQIAALVGLVFQSLISFEGGEASSHPDLVYIVCTGVFFFVSLTLCSSFEGEYNTYQKAAVQTSIFGKRTMKQAEVQAYLTSADSLELQSSQLLALLCLVGYIFEPRVFKRRSFQRVRLSRLSAPVMAWLDGTYAIGTITEVVDGQLKSDIGKILDRNDARVAEVSRIGR
ncbi:unnamed protein product, partial [Durusdinium trenchii]